MTNKLVQICPSTILCGKLACGEVESLTGMPASLSVPAHQVGPVRGVAGQGEDLECPSSQT